jgi:L-histidine N-alpha-methyltransferase
MDKRRDRALTQSTFDGRIRIDCWLDQAEERTLAENVRSGLTAREKHLPPKHFYDARGSRLFERICRLPEYYLTRAEREILAKGGAEIMSRSEAGELVELGSGAPDKARFLLDAMRGCGTLARYVPVDVSEHALRDSARQLAAAYGELRIHGVVGDFERQLDRVPQTDGVARVVALLGSTIGNFTPRRRQALLARIATLVGRRDGLLVGADLVKDPAVLEAAYNDAQGVTAEFNRNVLHVINRELGGDFDPLSFEHVAFFDRRREWMEMRLRARRSMRVRIADLDLDVDFAQGEDLRTEISAKFTRARLRSDLAAAGLRLDRWYTDAANRFALAFARRA